MLRDGRDVACSIKARTGDFRAGVCRWVEDNRIGARYWDEPRVRVVRYEDVVTDFSHTLRQVIAFIGESYESSLARWYETPKLFYSWRLDRPKFGAREHEQYRNWQINQSLFDGRGRSHQEMSAREKDLFNRLAGGMLVRYGYARDLDW